MNLVFEKFESFLEVVKEITLSQLDKAKELLKGEGKDLTDISDIFVGNSSELFDILPDGTLIKVNLYIATKNIDRDLDTVTINSLNKYHIYSCEVISNMFKSGRTHRYKRNNRDDGTFHYKLHDNHGNKLDEIINQELNICKKCLRQFLNHYASDDDVENFNLKEFHKHNSSLFNFNTSEFEKGEDATANVYSQRWNEISTQIKIKRDYTCESCGWKPKNTYQQRFVHTHHQNGDKTNNGQDNLKVLCIECHSNVDEYHTRIQSQNNYKEFIKIKKNPQPISTSEKKSTTPRRKTTLPPNIFVNPAYNKVKEIIINAPIIDGQKDSDKALISLFESNPKLLSEIWKYLENHNYSFIDRETLVQLLINMAEKNGYYSLKRVTI